jgi:hypothetical protein
MKYTHQSGSAIVLAVLFTTLLLVFAQPFVRTSTLLMDLAAVRTNAIQQRYAAQALLHWALNSAKTNWRSLIDITDPAFIHFNAWPLSSAKTTAAELLFEPEKEAIRITARIRASERGACVASARIRRIAGDGEKKDMFYISDLTSKREEKKL